MPPCLFNEGCLVQVKTRRFCSPCRLDKCFAVGMRKSCIMDEEAKRERREKIQRNRDRKVSQTIPTSVTSSGAHNNLGALSPQPGDFGEGYRGPSESPPYHPPRHRAEYAPVMGTIPLSATKGDHAFTSSTAAPLVSSSSSSSSSNYSLSGGLNTTIAEPTVPGTWDSWKMTHSGGTHDYLQPSNAAAGHPRPSMEYHHSHQPNHPRSSRSQQVVRQQTHLLSPPLSSSTLSKPPLPTPVPPPSFSDTQYPPYFNMPPTSDAPWKQPKRSPEPPITSSTSASSSRGAPLPRSEEQDNTSSTLPYHVKKTARPMSTVASVAPPTQSFRQSHRQDQPLPSQGRGTDKPAVTNVLEGHVWTSDHEESSNKECIALCPDFLKSGMARLLSKDQWVALNDLRSAYDTSFLDRATDHAPESSSNLTLSSLVNTSGFLVRKFINFAKKLADFSVLGQEGQICLLKGVVLNALFIRSASHYDVGKDVWVTPKGDIPTSILKIATGMETLYEEHAKYCRNFAEVVKKDSHLVALMQVLCLFAPDRPRLLDRQSVSNIYDRYILLLKHYLEARHGFTRGRTLLAAILTNLAELQALTDNYGHILLHVDPSKMDPLILEVFNLHGNEKPPLETVNPTTSSIDDDDIGGFADANRVGVRNVDCKLSLATSNSEEVMNIDGE